MNHFYFYTYTKTTYFVFVNCVLIINGSSIKMMAWYSIIGGVIINKFYIFSYFSSISFLFFLKKLYVFYFFSKKLPFFKRKIKDK